MTNQRLVLICGHAACLKTSLSLVVAPRLKINLVNTYGMGTFDPSSPVKLARDRAVRYERLFAIADTYLSKGLSIWVDGNFPRRAWRSKILDMARYYHIAELAVIYCHCSKALTLKDRFERRRVDPNQPDANASDMSAYYGSVSQFEPLLDSEFADIAKWEILYYDSCCKILAERSQPTALGSKIYDQMLASGFIGPA